MAECFSLTRIYRHTCRKETNEKKMRTVLYFGPQCSIENVRKHTDLLYHWNRTYFFYLVFLAIAVSLFFLTKNTFGPKFRNGIVASAKQFCGRPRKRQRKTQHFCCEMNSINSLTTNECRTCRQTTDCRMCHFALRTAWGAHKNGYNISMCYANILTSCCHMQLTIELFLIKRILKK